MMLTYARYGDDVETLASDEGEGIGKIIDLMSKGAEVVHSHDTACVDGPKSQSREEADGQHVGKDGFSESSLIGDSGVKA